MYDRPWLSVRNRYSTNFVYNCDTALLWRNLNRSITQELILNNHWSIFASRFALLRQSLNCIILKELTLHNPLSIYVSPLASLRCTRPAPYYRNCYSTTNFNVSSQLKCFQFVVDIRWSRVYLITWHIRYFNAVVLFSFFFSPTSNLLQRFGGFPSLLTLAGLTLPANA